MRVIILGHTGFVGNALLHAFEKEGKEVHGFSSATLDLRIPDSLQKIENLAGEETVLIVASAVTREKGDTLEVFNANSLMVANVARFLESHRVKKCVYFSSIAVYGDPETNLAINESTGVRPDSYYALAKYAGEFILTEASKRAGFPLVILRASRVYGPGDTHATYGPMKFIRSILDEGKVYLFGEGEELRDHLYIDDLVRLTELLMSGPAAGTFNLVTGKSRSFRELTSLLDRISPRPFNIVNVERKKPLIRQEFDIRKLLQAAPGFTFTDIRRGLQETFYAFTPVS